MCCARRCRCSTFFSGLYFPLRTLGVAGLISASLVPLGLGVDALRQVLLGDAIQGLLDLRTEVTLLVVLAVAFAWLSRIALAHLEGLSKREGRLTQRHH